jgi:hypothetical protein
MIVRLQDNFIVITAATPEEQATLAGWEQASEQNKERQWRLD